jgi:hypothetical protein
MNLEVKNLTGHSMSDIMQFEKVDDEEYHLFVNASVFLLQFFYIFMLTFKRFKKY